MADADIKFANDYTESTATGTTFTDGASLSTLSTGTEYLLIGTMATKPSGGTSDRGGRLVYGSTPTAFADAYGQYDPLGSDERWTHGGWIYRFTTSVPSETIKTQFNLPEGSGTITHQLSQILAIKTADLGTEGTDWDDDLVTADTTDAASLTSRSSVTLTANGTDVYLILGFVSWLEGTASGVEFFNQLYDNTSSVILAEGSWTGQDSTGDQFTLLTAAVQQPPNGSRTWQLRTASNTSQTISRTHLVVINLNKLSADVRWSYDSATEDPAASPSWTTTRTLTFTPGTAGDYVILAFASGNASSTTNMFSRLQVDSSSNPAYGDDAPDNMGGGATPSANAPWIFLNKVNLTAASHTINFDWQGTDFQYISYRTLVAFSVLKPSTGTTNYQTVAASITLTPLVVKSAQKKVTLGVTLAPVIQKAISKTITLTSTLGLGLNKLVSKSAFNTVVTLTPAVATSKVKQLVLAVTSTLTAGLSKMAGKKVEAGVTLTPGTSKRTNKNITAAVTFTLGLTKAVTRTIAAGVTLAASVVKSINKNLSLGTTLTPGLSRLTAKSVAAGVTFTAEVVKKVYKTLDLSTTLTAVLDAVKSGGTLFLQSVDVAVTFTVGASKAIYKAIPTDVTLTANLTKFVSKTIAPVTVTLTAGLTKLVNKTITALTVTLTAAMTRAKVRLQSLAVTVTLTPVLRKQVGKAVNATTTLTGAMVRRTSKLMEGSLTMTANITKRVSKIMQGLSVTLTAALEAYREIPGVKQAVAVLEWLHRAALGLRKKHRTVTTIETTNEATGETGLSHIARVTIEHGEADGGMSP